MYFDPEIRASMSSADLLVSKANGQIEWVPYLN